MDINIEKLKKLFEKKKNFRKENVQINPNLYWKYLLIFVLIIIVLSFIFGIYVYGQIVKQELPNQLPPSESEKTSQRDRIIEMVQYFRDRAKKSAVIQGSRAPVVDPSL